MDLDPGDGEFGSSGVWEESAALTSRDKGEPRPRPSSAEVGARRARRRGADRRNPPGWGHGADKSVGGGWPAERRPPATGQGKP